MSTLTYPSHLRLAYSCAFRLITLLRLQTHDRLASPRLLARGCTARARHVGGANSLLRRRTVQNAEESVRQRFLASGEPLVMVDDKVALGRTFRPANALCSTSGYRGTRRRIALMSRQQEP